MSAEGAQKIEMAWNQYVKTDILDIQVVRTEVANSWQRCRNMNVDPYSDVGADLEGLELKERLYKFQHLVNIARPFMENLYNFVKGSGFEVVLADDQGFLLEVLGDAGIVQKTREINLCPGGNWNEAIKGTNAIGTAIAEKKPIQIYAWEHFCQSNHFITCSAAPIFDPEENLIGVLDITGDYKVANPHTLGMVVAAVNAIENQLRLHKATTKLYLAYKYSNTIIESMSDGLISVDNNGIITQLNLVGAKILGINSQQSIGKHINNIIDIPAPMLQVLSSGTGYQDKEILLTNGRNKIFSSATSLRDDFGNIIGAVATIRSFKEKQLPKSKPTLLAKYVFADIIGSSKAIKEIIELARMAAESSSTVILSGDSGTGKELFAQAIHNASPRNEGPFIAINCAALPETLIESELFGYDEGAFTGSKKGGQIGKFELANGGTVFLDEVGDMPLNTQVKLLRVIQEKKVSRIGSAGEIPVDIRIIAATHKNLNEEVQKGNFREDLFYRLNVITIIIPSLRERMEDLPGLTEHFVKKISAKLGKKNIYVADNFIEKIKSYQWPGNIRELENVIERALNLVSDYCALTPELLPFDTSLSVFNNKPIIENKVKEVKSLRDMEKESIVRALKLYEGNISKVSAQLGIGRNTLYRKIKEYDIVQ